MQGKGEAFFKGGCGCLVAFAVLAVLALMMGGNVHVDAGGACCLFTTGGLIGLLVLWIYNKGRESTLSIDKQQSSPPDLQDGAQSEKVYSYMPIECPNCARELYGVTQDRACPYCLAQVPEARLIR